MSVTWWTRGDTFVGAPDGRDGANHSLLYDDADLPVVDTINGIQVSMATDYQTARSNVTQYPAIAADTEGAMAWVYDDNDLPYAFTADGLEVVLDTDFAAAQQTWSGARPAIVYGVAGYGEVMH
jgi:hypothetical protein